MPGILITDVEYQGQIGDMLVGATDTTAPYDHVINGKGLVAVPGFEDVHVHFREPGFTEKETLLTGARAAAAGGYHAVWCEPNTKPVIDSRALLDEQRARIAALPTPLTIRQKCALTLGQQGRELVEIDAIYAGTNPAHLELSSDGEPVADRQLLVTALRHSTPARPLRIHLHCEETPRSSAYLQEMLGDGLPMARETQLIRLALSALAEAGMGALHIQHVSLAESARLIAAGKGQGLAVTAEVAPHHLLLCAEDIPQRDGGPDANWKMNPPLRSREDMLALRQALDAGIIDMVATDHAPHTPTEKAKDWAEAPFGIIGLETAFGAMMQLVQDGALRFERLIAAMTGRQELGTPRHLTLLDLHRTWTVDPDTFYSKSRNCPFAGMSCTGKPIYTIANGTLAMAEGEVLF